MTGMLRSLGSQTALSRYWTATFSAEDEEGSRILGYGRALSPHAPAPQLVAGVNRNLQVPVVTNNNTIY